MRLRIQVYVPPFFCNHHGNTRTHETEGGGRGGRTHAHLSVRTTRRPDSHCLLFLRAPPPFPPVLALHVAGMPATRGPQPCAHPLCAQRFRDVKEGEGHATVNDWAGKGQRFPMCPNTGHATLNLREQAVPWQTIDSKPSTLSGSDLHEEQMRLHQSCGHTKESAEKETRKEISFYCLYHLDGQCLPRGKGSGKNGVCEGAVMRAGVDNAPPPPLPVDHPPACSTCKIHVKKHAALACSARVCNARGMLRGFQTSNGK
jgi:hypothetical protein